MNRRYLVLASRVREEMSELTHAVNRIQRAWERFKKTGDDFYLDSVALNLHSFYTAIEKIFEMIADAVDQSKPSFSSEDSSTCGEFARTFSASSGGTRGFSRVS